MSDDLVGVDRPAPGHLLPRPPEVHAPGAGVGGRVAHEPAGLALAHDEPVGARVRVELLPFAVVVGNDQRHAAVLDRLGHDRLLYRRLASDPGPPAPAVLRLALLASHDERAAGRGHGPAEVHRDLGVLDLAALARGIVVRVDALGGARTVVVHGAAQLAHVLDHHGHAVRVALAEVAARRVVGTRAPELDDPARHVGAALALLAEPVLLQLEHGGEREGVVGAGDVDVLGRDPGLRKDDVLGVVTGHPRDGAIRPVEVQARLRHAARDAHDMDRPVPQVA